MPKFPRFTSGTFGRLDFATMNDLFDRVEQLEVALGLGGKKRKPVESELLVVRPLERFNTFSGGVENWTFQECIETTRLGATMLDQGVRSSTGPNGDQDYPLVGINLEGNKYYLAVALYDPDGKLFYRVVQEGGAGGDTFFPAEITGKFAQAPYSDGRVYRWSYSFREMEIGDEPNPPFNLNWRVRVGGNDNAFNRAFNTLERDGQIGIGGSAPNIEETPTSIAVGTIVLMGKLVAHPPFYYFSAGPATNVRCL